MNIELTSNRNTVCWPVTGERVVPCGNSPCERVCSRCCRKLGERSEQLQARKRSLWVPPPARHDCMTLYAVLCEVQVSESCKLTCSFWTSSISQRLTSSKAIWFCSVNMCKFWPRLFSDHPCKCRIISISYELL